MPIYALGELTPTIDSTAFVHPDAVIIGDVVIGADSSIWPGAVLRGDSGRITIGASTSVQDNAVIHVTYDCPTSVGDNCVLGHLIHLEGCTIENEVLIGNASMVLHRCIVRTRSVVAANAVVLDDTEVPSGALAVGTPASIKPGRANADFIALAAEDYAQRGRRYRQELRRVD